MPARRSSSQDDPEVKPSQAAKVLAAPEGTCPEHGTILWSGGGIGLSEFPLYCYRGGHSLGIEEVAVA